MSRFRSLYVRYEQEAEAEAGKIRPWPATYRQDLPHYSLANYSLQVRIENQHAKAMPMKQLATLPSFTESRRVTSKAGWTYYGQWKGITFHTILNLFTTPHLYPWVRLESLNGEEYIIDRKLIMNYRLVTECDNEPLSTLYGGPVMIHCFDYYIEYAIPHVKGITLMQGDYQYAHPNLAFGYTLDQARVMPGKYYAIHHERITQL